MANRLLLLFNRFYVLAAVTVFAALNYYSVNLAVIRAASSPMDERTARRQAVENQEGFWKSIAAAEPKENASCRQVIGHALALAEARQHADRLPRLFNILAQMQDRQQGSENFGNFRWRWGDSRVNDLNAVEFCMHDALLLWLRHRDWIPKDSQRQLKEIMQYGSEACFRHRVEASYTNISLLNAGNLLLLGDILVQSAKTAEGVQRLDDFVKWTAAYGIHEICSPTYYGIDLNALMLIALHAPGSQQRRQAENVLRLLWTDIAVNWFPAGERLGGCYSRTADFLTGTGALDWHLWVNGWLSSSTPGKAERFEPYWKEWAPPASLKELSVKRLPRLVRESWGERSEQTRTLMMYPDITLSCLGTGYSSQDVPLAVDLSGSREAARCYFIADGRGDPYGKKKFKAGPEAHSKALHLKPFWIGAQRTSDAVGLAIYRPGDVKSVRDAPLQSHFVLRRDAQSFWLRGKPFAIAAARQSPLPIEVDDAIVLQYGTAALCLRVLAATTRQGMPAKVSLVDDGNSYGCLRLTIDHDVQQVSAGSNTPLPLAMAGLWIRVKSGLNSPAAFEAWRKTFESAKVTSIAVNRNGVMVEVSGVDGSVALSTKVSEGRCQALRLLPEPCRGVVELDGIEIGRPMLTGANPLNFPDYLGAKNPRPRASR